MFPKPTILKCLLAITLIASAIVPLLPPRLAAAAPGFSGPRIDGSSFVRPDGRGFFVLGINYEGHTDRAWHMWEGDYFDPALVADDLAQAQDAGFNSVRIFIQGPLRDDIRRGDFSKLDTVVGIAKAKSLYVIITLYDYEDRDLQAVGEIDRKIASRYAGESAVLAYDLKNEPQFGTIAFARYPAGSNVPLQTDTLIKQYGEKMSRAESATWRATGEGKGIVPRDLSDEQTYYFANSYTVYKQFLSAGESWVAKHTGKSTLDYMDSADSSQWRAFLDALNTSLATWIDVQRAAVQSADPNHPVTLSYSNLVLAKLPANGRLGFLSPHRFSSLGLSSFEYGMKCLENLRNTFPGLPIVLSEFGYSNASGTLEATVSVDQQNTAAHEAATWLYLYSHGFAGGLKWMLHNYSDGYNARENNFGVFDDAGNPKITYHTTKAISVYVEAMGRAGSDGRSFSVTAGPSPDTVDYVFRGAGGQFGTGRALVSSQMNPEPIHAEIGDAGQVLVRWGRDPDSGISVLSTLPGKVSLYLSRIVSGWDDRRKLTVSVDGGEEQQVDRSPGMVAFGVDANRSYRLDFGRPAAFEPAQSIGADSSRYFPETMHNLSSGFKYYWEHRGGLPIFGFPISEEFTEEGYTVQYFERARFEYHPEFKGTQYEVELGLLGSLVTLERRFDRSPAFSSGPDRTYYPETGHSLSFGFKYYWEHNGGLPVFGYPISEEFQEANPADGKTYTVQYFERARFEYHPEFKGTAYEVELGHLGRQRAADRGWTSW